MRMKGMRTSRIAGFYKKSIEERRKWLHKNYDLQDTELKSLDPSGSLPMETADQLVENVVGTFNLPLGLGLNFLINNKEYLVPMAVEEPSVIASASYIGKIVREAGGFQTRASSPQLMIGQIQVIGVPDFAKAKQRILEEKTALLVKANKLSPSLTSRGGGAKDLEVRLLNEDPSSPYTQMLVVHLYIDPCDAMGANLINTIVEGLAPTIEQLTEGKVYLRILSNYATASLVKATCTIPPHLLDRDEFDGKDVRDGIIQAYEFAMSDPYRAVTHNKGIMNGIDPVVIATGNDWRAVEAAAHAYAARNGSYQSMSTWKKDSDGNLVGELELPMSLGIVGGATRVHPTAKTALELLGVQNAQELSEVVVSVGLAQNLGALRALVTEGIQKGHMALHARSVAVQAGAEGKMVEKIQQRLIELDEIRVTKAKELLEVYKNEC